MVMWEGQRSVLPESRRGGNGEGGWNGGAVCLGPPSVLQIHPNAQMGLGKVTTNECPMELRMDYKLIRVGGGQTVLPYK